jgi:toxin ParE1/3/4
MRVSWLRSALRDLEGQIDFIAERNPGAAERLSRRIREAVDRLGNLPEIGREGRVPSTRELVIAGTRFIVVIALWIMSRSCAFCTPHSAGRR